VVTLVTDKQETAAMRSSSFWYLRLIACISNLSPNYTLQLTTLKTSVRESLQKYDAFDDKLVTLSQMFMVVYLRDQGYYCMIFNTSRCDPLTDVPVVTNCKILVARLSGNLPNGYFMQLAKHYHCFFQFVCNQGSHSVVKTTNLSLQ